MNRDRIVEATLFASQSPLTAEELARADDTLDPDGVREAIVELRRHYDEEDRAFQVYQLGGGFQVLTRPEFAPYLERFDSVPRSPGLSGAALETLAIIAYRQPLSRIEIEEVRGVDSSSVLKTLQEWELIEVVARGEGLGRPLLYGTTDRFLDHFGLSDLEGLPPAEELSVVLRSEDADAPRGGGESDEASGAVESEEAMVAVESEEAEAAVEGDEVSDAVEGEEASAAGEGGDASAATDSDDASGTGAPDGDSRPAERAE